MKAVIQRVVSASAAAIDGELISSIERGLCILVGISRDDTKADIEYMVNKIVRLRLFEVEGEKRWCRSVTDMNYEILCLSQITLYHSLKGNKLDFRHAMAPAQSKQFYEEFLSRLRAAYQPHLVKEGSFGAHLVINIQNDGPVTVVLESPNSLSKSKPSLEENGEEAASTLNDTPQ